MNRIADVFFIIAILLIFLHFKTTEFIIVFNLIPFISEALVSFLGYTVYLINLIAFFLFLGAMGKSAQIGLHTWLPDAMEGPTPVSSLLHAATMVTAGVFPIIRCSIIFEYSELLLNLLILFGGVTALFAGIVAIFQYDVKKIIAYSTCSQLGYMFFSCGLSNHYIAFFHLWNHAFFKALLFLSAGSLIHAFFDEQDMRYMGRLKETLPFTYICFCIGSLAIMGFPFLTGFYSKDLILEFAFSRFIINASFIHFLGLASAICTAVYSYRLLFFIFFAIKSQNGFYIYYKVLPKCSIECGWQMFIPMFFLSICSIFVGYIFSDLMLGVGQIFWHDSIYVLPKHFFFIETEFIQPWIKNLPVLLSFTFIIITYFFFNLWVFWRPDWYVNSYSNYYEKFYIFASWSYHAGFFNTIYNKILINILQISYININKYLDKGFFEYFGPFGVYKGIRFLHINLNFTWYSIIFFSISFMFIGMTIFVWYWLSIFTLLFISVIQYLGLLPILFLSCMCYKI